MSFAVECQNLVRSLGSRRVLDGIHWRIPAGKLTGLLGLSGAGKTTLARLIAGLDLPDAGQIDYAPELLAARPRVGFVFQNLALWPHLSVREHLDFVGPPGPRDRRQSAGEECLKEVQLPRETWDRCPESLSGGEGQRLAVARALAGDPPLLILDEPLAQMDMALRSDLLRLLKELAAQRRTTVIYITHSWWETLEACDHLALLAAGRMLQEGPTDEVYCRPSGALAARLSGPVCELPEAVREGLTFLPAGRMEVVPADAVLLARPQQFVWREPHGKNRWRVLACRPQGGGWQVDLSWSGPSTPLSLLAGRFAEPGSELGLCLEVAPDSWLLRGGSYTNQHAAADSGNSSSPSGQGSLSRRDATTS